MCTDLEVGLQLLAPGKALGEELPNHQHVLHLSGSSSLLSMPEFGFIIHNEYAGLAVKDEAAVHIWCIWAS